MYHGVQDGQDGQLIAYAGDYMRTVAGNNYLITETNAQGTGWDSKSQYPPYDNQLDRITASVMIRHKRERMVRVVAV